MNKRKVHKVLKHFKADRKKVCPVIRNGRCSSVAPRERPIGASSHLRALREKPLKRFLRSLERVFIPFIKQMFDFRGHFRHSAPTETHAFRLQTPGQRSEDQKRFPISFLGG